MSEFETLDYVSTDDNVGGMYIGDMWVLYSPQTKRLFDKQGKGSSLRGAAYYKTPTWANKANERLFGDLLQVRQAKTLKVCLSGECMGQVYPVEFEPNPTVQAAEEVTGEEDIDQIGIDLATKLRNHYAKHYDNGSCDESFLLWVEHHALKDYQPVEPTHDDLLAKIELIKAKLACPVAKDIDPTVQAADEVAGEDITQLPDFDELLGVTLERMVSEGKVEMNLHNGEPHYRLPTKEPVQAVCFSAQPVANGAEVPELEEETLCDGCHCPLSECICSYLAAEQAIQGDPRAMRSLGYTSQTIAWVEAGEVKPEEFLPDD